MAAPGDTHHMPGNFCCLSSGATEISSDWVSAAGIIATRKQFCTVISKFEDLKTLKNVDSTDTGGVRGHKIIYQHVNNQGIYNLRFDGILISVLGW